MRHVLLAAAMMCAGASFGAEHSALWGEDGEKWSAEGRLPDFSFAGYRRGEAQIPTPAVMHNVRDFGAVGDGVQDDSEAFLRAIAEMKEGVILVPAGRYVITKELLIDKPNVVIRGEGPEKTVLLFPTPLNDITPNWGATTEGRRTSNYSWSGGFIAIRGDYQGEKLAGVSSPALRGDKALTLDSAAALAVGQEVELRLTDEESNSLALHLYSGDPRTIVDNIKGRTRASLVARITAIDGNVVTIDRSLRSDVELRWQPALHQFTPTVTECGIESLRFEFPNTPYGGHFTELGFNAFAIGNAAHCWVRNVRVHNADSGGFISGNFNTLDGIVYTSERAVDANRKSTGHHGVTLGGEDNLLTNFDYQTKFIHDITVSGSAGNVASNGKGVDLSFDHHCRAPFENLFTNIDAGLGARVWMSGGGKSLGAHCGARGTFWNVRAAQPIAQPDDQFGPWSMNFVGVKMDAAPMTSIDGKWYEHTGTSVTPANLHEAQLMQRLATKP